MANAPTTKTLIKPEEGIRKPALVDDSKLLGVLATIDRYQQGEVDAVNIADTIDTLAGIIRQILAGESATASYLNYPAKNLQEIYEDILDLYEKISLVHTVTLKASEAILEYEFIRLTGNYAMGLAVGDTLENASCIGCLLNEDKAVDEYGVVALSGKTVLGILTDAVVGTKYYLHTSIPGAITDEVPTSGIQLQVGSAINSTDLLLSIRNPLVRA